MKYDHCIELSLKAKAVMKLKFNDIKAKYDYDYDTYDYDFFSNMCRNLDKIQLDTLFKNLGLDYYIVLLEKNQIRVLTDQGHVTIDTSDNSFNDQSGVYKMLEPIGYIDFGHYNEYTKPHYDESTTITQRSNFIHMHTPEFDPCYKGSPDVYFYRKF